MGNNALTFARKFRALRLKISSWIFDDLPVSDENFSILSISKK
jgi:hypothetical protein